jgi:hypothetical protein
MMHHSQQMASMSSSHDLVSANIPFTVDNKKSSSVAYNNNNDHDIVIHHHNLEEDTSVLGTNDECPNLVPSPSSSSSKFLLAHHAEGGGENGGRAHLNPSPQALIEDLNPDTPSNNMNHSHSDLFYGYSAPREIGEANTSLDFNTGPKNHDQMDGLWLLGGNVKATHGGTCPSNEEEDCLQFGSGLSTIRRE